MSAADNIKKLDVFTLFAQLYGPYAFGVASLLLIWFAIVKPELNNRAIDFKAHAEVLATLAERDRTQDEIARSMSSTAQTMAVTAQILERTVERLDRDRNK